MTNPIQDILPEPEPEVQKVLNNFADGIVECVNFGTHILKWDGEVNRKGDENLIIALNLRHALELINSSNYLIRNSSIDPCKFILKGILEVYFHFEYLFQQDTELRTRYFTTWYYRNKLKLFKKLDPKNQQSKQLEKSFEHDKSSKDFKMPEIPNLELAIKNLESLLNKPNYKLIIDEFDRLKELRIKNPNWYRLFDGPPNLEVLTRQLNLLAIYEVYYRGLSGIIHGTEVIDGKIFKNEDGTASILQINFAKEAQSITNNIMIFSIKIFRLFIKNRIKEKNVNLLRWYESIRPFFLRIGGEPIINM